MFAALHLTPYADVKVLILGQDPYHGAGQAHGLCFSVRPGVPPPPSLVNMFKELQADLGCPPPQPRLPGARGPRQGVLLLNAVLTVRARQAASHKGKGWETFTDAVIRAVNAKPEPVVFVLWGGYARRRRRAHRHQPPRRHRVGPPVAAVGATTASSAAGPSREQRRARGGRPRPDRLVHPLTRRRTRRQGEGSAVGAGKADGIGDGQEAVIDQPAPERSEGDSSRWMPSAPSARTGPSASRSVVSSTVRRRLRRRPR